jgi:hypothetical protein
MYVSKQINPSSIYSVWQKMNSFRATIPLGHDKFRVGDLVRITKEKLKLANKNISGNQG